MVQMKKMFDKEETTKFTGKDCPCLMVRFNKVYWPLMMWVLSFAMTGCDTEEVQVPAYLHIEPFSLQVTDPEVHGSVSEKITQARIFLLDKNTGESHGLGVLTLPGTVTSLVTGEQEINIDPMIKANGNTLYLQIYPFYNRFRQDLSLTPNGDVTVKPLTTYVNNAVFKFIEDFEGPEHIFDVDRDDNPNTSIELSQDDVFEGNYSGKVTLDPENNVFVVASKFVYTLSFNQIGKVFMEVNYKTDVPLEFGVLNIDAQGVEYPNFEFIVLARNEWNKIYFDMTDLVATASFDRFVFVIRGGIPFDGDRPVLQKAEIFLDNIKLIHF